MSVVVDSWRNLLDTAGLNSTREQCWSTQSCEDRHISSKLATDTVWLKEFISGSNIKPKIQNFQLSSVRCRTYCWYSSLTRPVRCRDTGAPLAGSAVCRLFSELLSVSISLRSASIFSFVADRSTRSCLMYSAPFCSMAALLSFAFGFCCSCGISECSMSNPFLMLYRRFCSAWIWPDLRWLSLRACCWWNLLPTPLPLLLLLLLLPSMPNIGESWSSAIDSDEAAEEVDAANVRTELCGCCWELLRFS